MEPQMVFWPKGPASAPERPTLDNATPPVVDSPAIGTRPVKLGFRISADLAELLTTRARECGLSQTAYVARLIAGSPTPSLDVVVTLGSSADRLATVSADLNELIRVLRRDASSSGPLVEQLLKPLTHDVREHLRLASRVVAELRPARAVLNPRVDATARERDGD